MSLALKNRGQLSFSLKWTTWIQLMRNTHHFLSCHWDLISWPFLSDIWFHALMLWWKGTKKRAWFFWLWQWKIEVNSLSVWNEQLEFKSERHPPFHSAVIGTWFHWPFLSDISRFMLWCFKRGKRQLPVKKHQWPMKKMGNWRFFRVKLSISVVKLEQLEFNVRETRYHFLSCSLVTWFHDPFVWDLVSCFDALVEEGTKKRALIIFGFGIGK